ncbi:hypothetical protein Desaci_4129 [Desulfosporosinus acidiphilus SJ4]|uniref:Uncharacterized protein n=1 Tax=Desulfosporosinus acidiphilus (strain DSM 22704 / JCM 16185 / SJ4) TaxID=646529 RepID=I4DB17_DESAJ|nr:hypothetical protein [Desulfosporosinus acidiphilus]AFM42991.1 hypothetical protein Desaci_4129 [Desulfosporosinus acidiphilus SJ4]
MSEEKSASTLCQNIRTYQDARGWEYFVRPGIGGDVFKTFYRRLGSKKERGYTHLPWRHSFGEALRDLEQLAALKKWKAVSSLLINIRFEIREGDKL